MSTQPYMTLPEVADRPFYDAVLAAIGAPSTPNTLMAMYAWRQAEGAQATYNPFNTTKQVEGSTRYGTSTAGKGGVQNYRTPQEGVDATVLTLTNGLYDHMIEALRLDKTPEEFTDALTNSKWGTGELARAVVDMYRRGKFETKPIATVPGAPSIASLASTAPPVAEIFKTETGGFNYWWLVAGAAAIAGVSIMVWHFNRED